MNIFHIITNLANGGAEKMTVELANQQVKAGHQVSIVLFDPLTNEMIHSKNLRKEVDVKLLKRKIKFDIILLFKLFSVVKKTKCDVIHTHKPSGILHVLPVLFFLKSDIHIIHTVHNELSYYKKLFSFLQSFNVYNKRVLNVCLSEEIQKEYQHFFPKMQFTFIPNGISKPAISKDIGKVDEYISNLRDQKTKILLFIGRNSEQKNLTLLFDLMNEVKKQQINCKLVCIGIEKDEIIKQYQNIHEIIDYNTYMVGTKSNIADYLANIDALILSSKNEGMPLVVIEALSYGKAIISTPVGSIPNMLNEGKNGFIASDTSLEGLLTALEKFMQKSDTELFNIKKNNITLFEKHYSIEECTRKYLNLYKS